MIVNSSQTGWEVIYQPAHALLAAHIASHWRVDQRPERWLETLVALAQHDDSDQANDWSKHDHLTDAGAPLDFILSTSHSLDQPKLLMQDLRYKGQWVALLISMHLSFLYDSLRDEDPRVAAFQDDQQALQKQWRSALKLTKKEADAAYALFQWCDRMSLILCRRELPDGERALEVSTGPDGTRYEVIYRDEIVSVRPWPFEEMEFVVSVETCQLSQLSYQDDRELETALLSTPITPVNWTFAKASR